MTFQVEVLSPKLVRRTGYSFRIVDSAQVDFPTMAHWCPACQEMHDFAVSPEYFVAHNGSHHTWIWDGNPDRPTVNPSMNIKTGWPDNQTVCHYYLHAGTIRYQGDCTHALAGATVTLPDIPDSVLHNMKAAAGALE